MLTIRAQEEEGITRVVLSRRLCEWLGWRSVSGRLREIEARKVLLALERDRLIELPAARAQPCQAQVRVVPEVVPDPQITGDLAPQPHPVMTGWRALRTSTCPRCSRAGPGRQRCAHRSIRSGCNRLRCPMRCS